jgi:signal transduction histidine kinase
MVVFLCGAIAYREVRATALETAAERLTTVVQVLAQPTATGGAWVRDLQTVARRPGVLEIVRSDGQRISDSARAAITRLTPDTGLTLATDVRAVNGALLFSITSPANDSAGATAEASNGVTLPRDSADGSVRVPATPRRLQRTYPDSAVQSQLYVGDGKVLFERAVPIRENGRLVGHVVQVRGITSSANAVAQLGRLIGKDAALVVGNADGSLWTDFRKDVAHPPPSDVAQRYDRDGRRWISATHALSTGPWVIGAELPEDVVLAPVYTLRWRLFLMGMAIVVLAVLVSERLSRRLTLPLKSLTTAAEQIASGHRHTPIAVALDRSDEIGRLSRAFSVMADSIRSSHDTLEHQIGERTQDLQAALIRLQQAQDELVRQERLATLGHLSGSIAHELRNPLGVMTNALYYLEAVLGDAPPKVRDHLTKLRSQVRLSESIITGLLNVTRTGAPQPSSIPVVQIVDEQLARAGVPPSITVKREFAEGLPNLRADPVQVGQILMNLFTNALQAMEVEATPGVLTVRARSAADVVRIEVTDTGPGIRLEDSERIFEPLYTTKARGIGLGLSVSRSLARANKGELSVVRGVDKGATLALDLPGETSVDAGATGGRREAAVV